MVHKIVTRGDETLEQVARPIDPAFLTSEEGRRLITDMIETMHAANGIGLAAPQIGKSLQLAVIAMKDGELAIANPAITTRSFRKVTEEEGCLSVPGVFGKVKRHRTLTLRYTDREGAPQELEASGLFARVIQHEVDHLHGILYLDRTTTFTRGHP